jgi:hypothetical protein
MKNEEPLDQSEHEWRAVPPALAENFDLGKFVDALRVAVRVTRLGPQPTH